MHRLWCLESEGLVLDCIEALARSGVGKLILIDNDTVSLTNINRQSIAYHSTVGKYKTKVMEERIRDICPEIQVVTYELFVLPDNLETLFTEKVDYIIDAIDTVTAKLALVEVAKEKNIPIICSMGTGNKLHPEMFEITDISKTSVCPLCKVMRKELKARGIKKLKVLYSKRNSGGYYRSCHRRRKRKSQVASGKCFFCPTGCRTNYRRRSDSGTCRGYREEKWIYLNIWRKIQKKKSLRWRRLRPTTLEEVVGEQHIIQR